MAKNGLAYGPLGEGCVHLCVDMQVLFAPGSPWSVPWMENVLPAIAEISGWCAASTIFTRFIPPRSVAEAKGTWARYYKRWEHLTLENLDPGYLDLVEPLVRLVPPARVLDKRVYSPWTEGNLDRFLQGAGVHTLVVTGGETDICVLASVLGAIDRGYRVVLVSDAVCSSADNTHDALMELYHSRFSAQVEVAGTEEVLAHWPRT